MTTRRFVEAAFRAMMYTRDFANFLSLLGVQSGEYVTFSNMYGDVKVREVYRVVPYREFLDEVACLVDEGKGDV